MSRAALLLILALLGAGAARADPAGDLLERYRRARAPEEREAVVAALRQTAGATAALAEVVRNDPEERLRLRAVEGLVALGTDEAARLLLTTLDRWDPFVTDAAVRGLAARGVPPETVTWLLEHGLREGSPDQQAAVVTLLAGLERDEALPAIRKASEAKQPRLRAAAAAALAYLAPEASWNELRRLADDDDLRVRTEALAGLEKVPGDAAWKLLRKAARSDSDWQGRLAALEALLARDLPAARPLLFELLRDLDLHWPVRLAALHGLEGWRDPKGIEARIDALRAADGRLEAALTGSLQALTGQPHATHEQWKAWWRTAKEGYVFPEAPPPVAQDALRTRARFYDLPIESECVCFVIDASGSMAEQTAGRSTIAAGQAPPTPPSKWEVAKVELGRALSALPERARFGLILFSDRLSPLQTSPVPATKKNVARALELLEQHGPEGLTDVYGALALLFHAGEPSDPVASGRVEFDTFVLLSDGLPTAGVVRETPELLRRMREWNRLPGVRIHAIGLGEPNRELLEGLARESGGRFAAR